MKKYLTMILILVCVSLFGAKRLSYRIVDTGQIRAYGNSLEIEYPKSGKQFYGQDSQYLGYEANYRDNKNGTVSDLVTGLMWTQDPGEKVSYEYAVKNASKCRVGGHKDWRLPTIKELYSLIDFSGEDVDFNATDVSTLKPFINTKYFKFVYGDVSKGERVIDSQFATSTIYEGKTMGENETMFGVNFADGRIKGYPVTSRRKKKTYFVLYVRGNKNYGKNRFIDKKDGTVFDAATGLTWMKADSKKGMNWEEALEYSEKLKYSGKSDWRLPNAKELQSIIDYSRSPSSTKSAAVNQVFDVTVIKGEGGEKSYPYYWSSTTHKRDGKGSAACYFCFGEGYGWMTDRRTGAKKLMDVHGAGCQRSDPKAGDPKDTPYGRGPQGDVLRIYNFVRCVRGGKAEVVESGPKLEKSTSRRGSKKQSGKDRLISRLDKDGDGKVSEKEFDGPRRHFSELDKNNDGFLTDDEAPQRPSKRR